MRSRPCQGVGHAARSLPVSRAGARPAARAGADGMVARAAALRRLEAPDRPRPAHRRLADARRARVDRGGHVVAVVEPRQRAGTRRDGRGRRLPLVADWIFLAAAALTVLISFAYLERERLLAPEYYVLLV